MNKLDWYKRMHRGTWEPTAADISGTQNKVVGLVEIHLVAVRCLDPPPPFPRVGTCLLYSCRRLTICFQGRIKHMDSGLCDIRPSWWDTQVIYQGYHLETRGFSDCGHCCVLSLCPCWTFRKLVAKSLPLQIKSSGRIFFAFWQAQLETPEDADTGDFPLTGTAWHSTIKLTVKKLHPFRQPQMKKFSKTSTR